MQTLSGAYRRLLEDCLSRGETRIARGRPHKSLFNVVWEHSARRNMLGGISKKFAIAELMAYVCGWGDVAWLARFNKNIAQFSDDGVYFAGAYGPRMSIHFEQMIELLRRDLDTRQAVIPIYEPRDVCRESKDIPCNTHFQLQLIGDALHMTVYQRSCDLIWGLPYDHFSFSTLLTLIAAQLQFPAGAVCRFIANAHIYHGDAGYADDARIQRALETKTQTLWVPTPLNLFGFIEASEHVRVAIEAGNSLKLSPTERWLYRELGGA